ncbi:hexaprenyl pyrophosphate synthetase [Mucor ambiguus]|uniref:Hexaprenyl pyrophosphate synthetase n=1 Tax=Mucor ambiguus TaxID=91626 RepID=A0A0C9N319_9FUNG|nr:hexaprenyl pyrophosphate synthetase [Mucor ambiguus]
MLSRTSIKTLSKSSALMARSVSVATFHHTSKHCSKKAAVELKPSPQDDSPFDKLAQGMNVLKSTLLTATPLRKATRPNIESLPFTGHATSWDQAVKEAQSLVNSADQERIFDPVKIVGKDLWELKGNITKLLGSGHPFINTIGKHYFQGDTNRIRPLLVLLIAKATSQAPKKSTQQLLHEDVDSECQVSSAEHPILPTQRRLAEISEMIYTSSLLHYDVIDNGEQVTNPGFGNKMAVLAGDFLLARASLALAQLKKAECIELIATCIANLVEGEFMQLHDLNKQNPDKQKVFDYYLEKVYLKTGSLIAQSCKASSVLGGCSSDVAKMTYDYGKNLGIASQLIDDLRDFSQDAANIEKKKHNAGWITAPVLLAWEEHAELGPLIERGFSEPGDAEKVCYSRTHKHAQVFTRKAGTIVDLAVSAIEQLPTSEAQAALIQLARNLSTRKD